MPDSMSGSLRHSEIQVPRNNVLLYGGDSVLACAMDGQLDEDGFYGYFFRDTRVLSTYRLGIAGHRWQLLSRTQSRHDEAQWHYQNPPLRGPHGLVSDGIVQLALRRRLSTALHDDLHLLSFVRERMPIRLTLQIDGDFADIFQVHDQSIPPHLAVERVPSDGCLELRYHQRGFRRGLRLTFDSVGPAPIFVGALVVFELELGPGVEWRCCIEAAPILDGLLKSFPGDPHQRLAPDSGLADGDADGDAGEPVAAPGIAVEALPLLARPVACGRADLRALAVHQPPQAPYVAAGAPWFYTLFGRDPLMAGLMAGLTDPWILEGALAALAPRQAQTYDDFRDAQPGKILHEARWGELSWEHAIVASPYYYGTADAPALFCLALWQAWRWTGERRLLDRYIETARTAMSWCEDLGDLDGDGFIEYITRSPRGYRNQGWKDSGDAIVFADGRLADPPIALVEIQGYWFAARLAMAEIADELGDADEAARLRAAAERLRGLVEERFWMPEAGFYALALDRDKRQVDSISSNPGQLLWTGLPRPERVAQVAARLLQPDMFSGWGLRTLSSANPAYNPLAYQVGSVWPHDTMLAAAGLWRYGLRESASTLLRATLDAANAFERERLPELFCGFDRAAGLPVPYARANSPQAWAAAAPILAVQLILGLVPDAPRGRCWCAPDLPSWLPALEVTGLAVGNGTLDIRVVRAAGGQTRIDHLDAKNLQVVQGAVEASLWGGPPPPPPPRSSSAGAERAAPSDETSA